MNGPQQTACLAKGYGAADKTWNDGQTDNMQFLVWPGSLQDNEFKVYCHRNLSIISDIKANTVKRQPN